MTKLKITKSFYSVKKIGEKFSYSRKWELLLNCGNDPIYSLFGKRQQNKKTMSNNNDHSDTSATNANFVLRCFAMGTQMHAQIF